MKLAIVAKGTHIVRTPKSENKKLYVANSVIQQQEEQQQDQTLIKENALGRNPNASTNIYHWPCQQMSKIPIPKLNEPATCQHYNHSSTTQKQKPNK